MKSAVRSAPWSISSFKNAGSRLIFEAAPIISDRDERFIWMIRMVIGLYLPGASSFSSSMVSIVSMKCSSW